MTYITAQFGTRILPEPKPAAGKQFSGYDQDDLAARIKALDNPRGYGPRLPPSKPQGGAETKARKARRAYTSGETASAMVMGVLMAGPAMRPQIIATTLLSDDRYYSAITYLQRSGYAECTRDGNRYTYRATDAGRAWLQDQRKGEAE